MSANLTVSVIITCYNYGRYLPDAINSVLQQSIDYHELIVVDDGSTDETSEVLDQFRSKQSQIPLTIITQANSGNPACSRNRGIDAARGEYILCLDADDMIHPQMIEVCHLALMNNPWASIAYTDRHDFDGVSQIVKAKPFDPQLLPRQNHISYCALYKKDMWKDVGGYRTNIRGGEDWDFWIAAALRGFRGLYIPEPLFFYRRHDTGLFQEAIKNFDPIWAQLILNNLEGYTAADVEWARHHQNS